MNNPDNRVCAPYLSPRFISLSPLPEALKEHAQTQTIKAQNTLSIDPNCCYGVISGLICECAKEEKSDRVFLSYFLEADSLFLDSQFCDKVVIEQMNLQPVFRALKDTELLIVDSKILKNLTESDEEVRQYISNINIQKRHLFTTLYFDSQINSVASRLATFIYTVAVKYGEKHGEITAVNFPLTHNELSMVLGVNRLTVTRSMKQLRNQGYLGKYDDLYCIKDMEAFTEYVYKLQNM